MKRFLFALSALFLLLAVLSACGTAPSVDTAELADITLETHTLDDLKKAGYVVMENGDVTAGEATWADFYKTAARGEPACVRYVTYYTLRDPSHYDPAYYQEIKDNYPCMFVHELTYDGTAYRVVHYEEGKRLEATFPYLLKFDTLRPQDVNASAIDRYTYYVLTDDATVTWTECMHAMVSSNSADFINFRVVYSDLTYKEQAP